MRLAPFGALKEAHRAFLKGIDTPMNEWRRGHAAYAALMRNWLERIEDSVWPRWDGGWKGGAAARMEDAARAELDLAVRLYHGGHGGTDILATAPEVPPAPDGRTRDHAWHYRVEDALVHDEWFRYTLPRPGETPSLDFRASHGIGPNYLLYEPGVDIAAFKQAFWGKMPGLQPGIFDIKGHFQRPRPYTAAAALGVTGFRWITADMVTHTGVHPSIISGHCIQGILAGCAAFEAMGGPAAGAGGHARFRALQQYMVEWGDRRVFAGVHYMTDNIASWTLARALIPDLFEEGAAVEAFAVDAITRRSRVFADIVEHFDADEPARRMLLRAFPEADPDAPAEGGRTMGAVEPA